MTESRTSRAERLRNRLKKQVRLVGSERSAAKAIGVSPGALSKFLNGAETPYERTLDKYEEWLRAQEAEAAVRNAKYSDADSLIWGVEQQEGMTDEEVVLEVYRRAIRRRLPTDAFGEIDAWRNKYLRLEGANSNGDYSTESPA